MIIKQNKYLNSISTTVSNLKSISSKKKKLKFPFKLNYNKKNNETLLKFFSILRPNLKGNLNESKYNTFPKYKKLSIDSHLIELRERFILVGFNIICSILFCFGIAKDLLIGVESIALGQGYSFLQLSPGDFFFSCIEVSVYLGLLSSIPGLIYHSLYYLRPGLSGQERNFYLPVVVASIILYLLGVLFSYYILCPIAVKFFFIYSFDLVESTLSIKQYFEFYFNLLINTALAFQVPIIQLIFTKSKLVTPELMLKQWKNVTIVITIISAIITPTTDPVTQLLVCTPLLLLYFLGILISKYYE